MKISRVLNGLMVIFHMVYSKEENKDVIQIRSRRMGNLPRVLIYLGGGMKKLSNLSPPVIPFRIGLWDFLNVALS